MDSGSGTRGQEEIEVNLVRPLHDRRAGTGPDWRDELPRMDLVIGRGVLPERDRADRAGDDSKRWEIDSDAREGPRIISPLLVPGDSRDAVERKYRRRSARAQVEICRFGRGRFDLIADLFQDGCDGLRCEDTGSHNISFLYAKSVGRRGWHLGARACTRPARSPGSVGTPRLPRPDHRTHRAHRA